MVSRILVRYTTYRVWNPRFWPENTDQTNENDLNGPAFYGVPGIPIETVSNELEGGEWGLMGVDPKHPRARVTRLV